MMVRRQGKRPDKLPDKLAVNRPKGIINKPSKIKVLRLKMGLDRIKPNLWPMLLPHKRLRRQRERRTASTRLTPTPAS